MNFDTYMKEARLKPRANETDSKPNPALTSLIAHHKAEESRHQTLYKMKTAAKNPDAGHHSIMSTHHQNIHKHLQSALDNMGYAHSYRTKHGV